MTDKLSPAAAQPESPTTAREPDFDDTPDVSELSVNPRSGASTPTGPGQSRSRSRSRSRKAAVTTTKSSTAAAAAPAQPDIYVGLFTPAEKEAMKTLHEAFPGIDCRVIRAVLRAADFKADRAFEPLLEFSDPSYVVEEPEAPTPPPRPSQRSQVESDEQLARRLAAEFNQPSVGEYERRTSSNRTRQQTGTDYGRTRSSRTGAASRPQTEEEPSFFDDELPKIGKQIQQSFYETQTTLNRLFTDFKKKIDGDDDSDGANQSDGDGDGRRRRQPAYGSGSRSADGSAARSDNWPAADPFNYGTANRSNSLYRSPNYDADPRVLDVDELYGDNARPAAVSPALSPDQLGRKSSPAVNNPAGPGGSGKKWQPLNAMPPASTADRSRDPFELGDSDDDDLLANPSTKIAMDDSDGDKPGKKT